MTSVSVDGISKSLGGRKVLREISVQINQGEFFFLLGPSGCGKTTLLRILSGFLTPDSGVVCFDGMDVTRLAAHKRNVSLVFQNYALWPHMNVFQNVAFGLEMRNVSQKDITSRVEEMLSLTRLSELTSRIPSELSGGQQQRVALARALVVNPSIVLFDEPLSNLDAKLRHDMRRTILDLHQKFKFTAIYVTHDQEEALSMADRIAVMNNGILTQLGTAEELYQEPNSPFVAQFIGEANLIEGTVSSADGTIQTPAGPLKSSTQLQSGARVQCLIRPEHFQIGATQSANLFKGQVIRTAYLGSQQKIEVAVSGGIHFQISNRSQTRLIPGAHVEISVDPKHILTYPLN